MRIISGIYKGKHIDVPASFKARPTTDFAKESLFNILSNVYIDFEQKPTALDLFAGTGSISLELLSRGCQRVVSVEKDYKQWTFLSKTSKTIGNQAWKTIHADVFKFINKVEGRFDIIFADPPYALKKLADIPNLVLDADIIGQDGIFILAHGKDYDFTTHSRFIDHRNYGSVNFSFFR